MTDIERWRARNDEYVIVKAQQLDELEAEVARLRDDMRPSADVIREAVEGPEFSK